MIKKHILKNKDEWLEARENRIGGSDAACILGLNPYKSNVDLWEEKLGLREPENISEKSYVKYGTEAEKHLRELFKLDFPYFEVIYDENNLIINNELPFAHASLDGEIIYENVDKKGILEIKTSTIFNSIGWDKWKDRIPDNYYIQCLHYLMVTEYDFVCLKAQLKSATNKDIVTTKHYFINKEDVLDDIKYLKEKEEEFYNLIINKKRPNLILPEI